MKSISVADLLIQRISRDGIDTVFSVTGGGIMYLIDSIARSDNVNLISTHHEEFAGVAADGYARSGKPYGVAFATAGPGATHFFTAVAAAWQDSSPVLFIAGQVKTSDSSSIQGFPLRQNGTFEFDTTKSFAHISKNVSVLRSPQTAADDIENAIRIMQEGRTGPVVIEIPLDVQGAIVDDKHCRAVSSINTSTRIVETTNAQQSIASALSNAKRPLVLLGIGTIRAAIDKQIVQALDETGVPYVTTQFARSAGRRNDPLFLGSPGIKGNRSANLAVINCDTLIAIGTSLHQQIIGWDSLAFKNSQSHKIWLEVDRDNLQTRCHLVDEAIQISAQDAGVALISELVKIGENTSKNWQPWRLLTLDWCSKYLLHFPAHSAEEGRMCLYRVITALDKYSEYFSAVVTDAGLVWYAVAQHYFVAEDSHFLSSGSFGSMGMALPLAIGASASTKRPVVAITGDGSIMMCLSELATLKAQGLPVLVVVNNNDGYASIRSTHDRYFEGRKIGTDGSNGVFIPNFKLVASTFEIPYRAAHSLEQLEQHLDELFSNDFHFPVLLEVFTYRDQKVEPLVISRRGADGLFISSSLADMDPPIEITND